MTTPTLKTTQYSLVCGLEVHAELSTQSKMFCGCKNDPFHAPKPNIHTCPVCLGMPGALPVPNKKAIEWTIMVGKALGCEINQFSKFDRKNYFYPDLAKGYQISQYDIPFCEHGKLETSEGVVGIRRIHLEEDTGKLVHTSVNGEEVSLVDFNRSSVPLMEVVTEADIFSPSQAKEYGKKLRQLLRYLGVAECDMEQGGMRLEANISLQTPEQKAAGILPGYKVEVKNINSFRFLEQAIQFEIKRQTAILETGQLPIQETRGFNAKTAETFSQRTKEDAEDYRYFPDPDIPPIRISDEHLEAIVAQTPELPGALQDRWSSTWDIPVAAVAVLSDEPEVARFADQVFQLAQDQNMSIKNVANALVNKKVAWSVSDTPQSVLEAIKAQATTSTVNDAQLAAAIDTVMQNNMDAVAKYKAGETKVLGFIIGQLMRELPKGSDPSQIRAAVTARLVAK